MKQSYTVGHVVRPCPATAVQGGPDQHIGKISLTSCGSIAADVAHLVGYQFAERTSSKVGGCLLS